MSNGVHMRCSLGCYFVILIWDPNLETRYIVFILK